MPRSLTLLKRDFSIGVYPWKFYGHRFLHNTSDGCFLRQSTKWIWYEWSIYFKTFKRLYLTIPFQSRTKRKNNLNVYFHTSLCCLKRFYKGLSVRHYKDVSKRHQHVFCTLFRVSQFFSVLHSYTPWKHQ